MSIVITVCISHRMIAKLYIALQVIQFSLNAFCTRNRKTKFTVALLGLSRQS
jgi:hypothetical protein